MNKLNIHEIMQHLPHRYPFLLIDRVIELEKDKSIHAYKNVTINEPFFIGHFPGYPIMPGVLIMEALAQAAGVYTYVTLNEKAADGSLFFYAGIDNARFKKPVTAGDQLHLHAEVTRRVKTVWKFKAEARVDGEIVAEADLMFARGGPL